MQSTRAAIAVALIGAVAVVCGACLTPVVAAVLQGWDVASAFGRWRDEPARVVERPFDPGPPPTPTIKRTPTPTAPTVDLPFCAVPADLPPSEMEAVVTTTHANLRAGPGEGCEIIETVPEDATLGVLSGPVSSDDGALWLNVAVMDSGSEGWVNLILVTKGGEAVVVVGTP